ncbi:MAG TPA: formate dehydrogenase accessory sulfurtransferase FdhD [Candidatus Binataceae bacterium]|nr:formate dehydrogenase accessory sulfurtransferase FdhD [Candidatus Binataceae bacterium]
MSEFVKKHPALKWRAGAASREDDPLAVEEPLEIRLGGRRFTLTMRTPGHDEELAAGFLLAEGFINSAAELGEIRRLRDSKGAFDPNALDVMLNVPAAGLRERLKRNFNISSSCGVCGKTSIEALERRIEPLSNEVRFEASTIMRMPAIMREAQAVFRATGGLHAAALFERPAGGDARESAAGLIVLREDIGRHNAVDKVTGYALQRGLVPLSHSAMMVSGRLSFEIVQKAAAAGIPVLCAVSAPSSLAVELAEEVGMTLIGFLREQGFNVYTREERIIG